jgi:heme exporter protein B
LTALGAIGAALTLGVRGGSVLLSLLVLPLMVPVLVFGAGALEAQMGGLGIEAHVSILLAMMLGSLALSPFACAMAIKLSVE